LSKIFKSGQCVETHPRQLQPVDVDSFFIHIGKTDQEDLITETSSTSSGDLDEETSAQEQEESSADQIAEETVLELTEEKVSTDQDEKEETAADDVVVTINPADRKRLQSVLLDYDDQPKPKINVRQEKLPVDAIVAKQEAAPSSEPETVNLEHIANVAATIESLFSGAKQQAGTIAESAKQQAGTITEVAKHRADEIAFGAEHKADSIIGQASNQAETIISEARNQSDLLIEGAGQQAEKTIEKAKHQAGVIFEDAKKEAAAIVEDVQKQTGTMLEEAKQQSIAIKEQAHQDGLITGRQEAVKLIRQELTDNLTQALSLINEIESERMQRLTSSEPELIKLAVTIAEKIIGEELSIDALRQLQIVREALSRVATANTITIRIHSDDLQSVNEHLTMLQSSFSEPKPIKVVEDCSIAKGSCFIETDNGNLDARIKSQLDRIMTELLKVGRIE
jgi:flagellar assembly protein FliH